jgi:hypothetical protein
MSRVKRGPSPRRRHKRVLDQVEGFFGGRKNRYRQAMQGFGRLIRSRQDVGVVVLLDRRVVAKRYGPLILNGLPPADRVIGPWLEVLTKCEDFFARYGIGAEAV